MMSSLDRVPFVATYFCNEASTTAAISGHFKDPANPDGASAKPGAKTEQDWKIITAQAESVARKAGHLPGCFAEILKGTRESKVSWAAELQSFITKTIVTDVSWSRPSRRFISQGIYLPGNVRENIGEIVAFIDSSGSCTTSMQEMFASELKEILRVARPEKLWVVHVDTKVQSVREYTADDDIDLKVPGRGG